MVKDSNAGRLCVGCASSCELGLTVVDEVVAAEVFVEWDRLGLWVHNFAFDRLQF